VTTTAKAPEPTIPTRASEDAFRAADLFVDVAAFLATLKTNTAESFRIRCQHEAAVQNDLAVYLRREDVIESRSA
jgi:hypothetical protein